MSEVYLSCEHPFSFAISVVCEALVNRSKQMHFTLMDKQLKKKKIECTKLIL